VGRVIDVTRAADRFPGGDPAEGITSWHAFSFGPHYDPDRLRFGPLIACNEELLAPGVGFTPHTHREVEIVTWVVEGVLEHHDDAGHHGRIRAGRLQWLSAGAGVRHSEGNASTAGPCRFVQMWLEPASFGGAPAYGTTTEPVVRPPRLPGAELRVARTAMTLPAGSPHYVHVVRGRVRLADRELGPGDAARPAGGAALTVEPSPDAEYLVWRLPTPAETP
jgi:quercetin 2,3-dioxygenase